MLTPQFIIIVLILAFIVWFWANSVKCKEKAAEVAKSACEKRNFQLLDETVALKKIKFARHPTTGKISFRRIYKFEYDDGSNARDTSFVILNGRDVTQLGFNQGGNVLRFPGRRP